MDLEEIRKRNQKACDLVEKVREQLRDVPLKVLVPKGVPHCILLGMRFKVNYINYVDRTITFALSE